MAPKMREAGAPDDVEAKRCRLERLGELVAKYGDDANLIEPVDVVIAGGVTFRVMPLLLAQSDVFRGMLTSASRNSNCSKSNNWNENKRYRNKTGKWRCKIARSTDCKDSWN